jgi:hypothetical protein
MMAGGAHWACRNVRTSSGVMLSRQSGSLARQNRQCVSSLRRQSHSPAELQQGQVLVAVCEQLA